MLPPLTIATIGTSSIVEVRVEGAAQHGGGGGRAARLGDDLGVREQPEHRVDDLPIVHRDHGVDEPAARARRSGRRDGPASGRRRRCAVLASVTGWPASTDAFIAAAPAGSTPITCHRWLATA